MTGHLKNLIFKILVSKSKLQNEWDQRKRHCKQKKLDIGCFCVGNDGCKKLRWEKNCDNFCPCMNYGEN